MRIVWKKGSFEKGFTPNWTEEVFTITAVKATKPATYTTEDTLGEPVQGTRASVECAGNLPHRASGQEGKRPSACQVERLQQCVQFVDTTSRS